MRIRGAVLEQTGGPLDGVRARPRAARRRGGARPSRRERRLPLGLQRDRRHRRDALPGRARPRGGRRRRGGRAGVTRVAVGDHVALSWAPSCGACEECLRDLPWHCSTAWPAMGTGGLMDGTPRLSRNGASRSSTTRSSRPSPRRASSPSARACRSRATSRSRSPGSSAARSATGVGAVWRTAGVRPGERVAVIGCGGVGLSALMAAVAVGAEPVIAVDTAPQKLDVARSFGATARRAVAGQRRGDRGGDP